MITKLLAKIFGTQNERELKAIQPIVSHINELEARISEMTDGELAAQTGKFKEAFDRGATLDTLLPEAFATVREAGKRSLGMRHYDVQMCGGIVLHQGKIAEMRTGEGKTLVSTLPLYLNALAGKGAHLVTVNDYLVRRDAEWMGPLYSSLGLSVGVIQSGMDDSERKAAYSADITYGTNSEFGFEYLRDNMKFSLDDVAQRGHYYAIVDEVDSILIDEARTPLIISGASDKSSELYHVANKVVTSLHASTDYEIDQKGRNVHLSEAGVDRIEGLLKIENLYASENILLLHHLQQALKAHTVFDRDKHYVVNDGEVLIVDEFTGRTLPGRRYSDGLHQALEAKENVEIERESQTYATITLQNYFRLYNRLAGMTGTAETEAAEFYKVYGLGVVVIPTHRPIARIDEEDAVLLTRDDKFNEVIRDIKKCYEVKQPVLVGTASIEASEYLSRLLSRQGIKHDVLNAKQHEREADIVAHAGELGHITVATNMAGRGTDIKLGEGVRELGGLRIIGTERHESRRIDNQLRGRAGRQGDPGSSKFYISLEDDFIFRTQGDRMKKLMQFAGMEPGEVIESSMITSSIERAQRSIEEYNFDVRKQRLRYDDVMNQQRRVIYSYRKEILHDLSSSRSIIKDFIHGAITELASNIVGNLSLSHDHVEMIKQRVAELGNVDIETVFAGFAPHVSTWDALVDQLVEHVLHRYEESSSRINHEIVEQNERWILLETVDFAWRTHLNNLEQIYDGISFRGNAQRDPLIEYKKESFLAFEQMMLEIKYNVLGALIRTQADLSQEALERIERERKAELNALVNSDSSSTDKDSGASSSASHDGGNRKARRARSRRR